MEKRAFFPVILIAAVSLFACSEATEIQDGSWHIPDASADASVNPDGSVSPDGPADTGFDGGIPDSGVIDAGEDSGFDGGIPDSGEIDSGTADGGSIDIGTRPPTTVLRTLKPKLPLVKQSPSTEADWDKYTMDGPGEWHLKRDDLGASKFAGPPGIQNSFLYLAHVSDAHVVDYQSPDRLVRTWSLKLPSYRPQEGWSVPSLDAFISAVNRFNSFRAFDGVVFTGDGVDNNQYNEFRYFIDTMDGFTVSTNSGNYSYEGSQNMCEPVDTEGIDTTIPWYYVFGNHDALMLGNFAVVSRNLPVDEQAIKIKDSLLYQRAIGKVSEAVIMCQLGILEPWKLSAGTVNATDSRSPLTHNQVMQELFDTTSNPAGHGMTLENVQQDFGSYTIDLPNRAPVRLVMMDFTWSATVFLTNGVIFHEVIDNYLKPVLDQALADNVLVIMGSHFQTYSIASQSEVTGKEYAAFLAQYPNVILNLVGHGHMNDVRAHPSGRNDGYGFWEVQTPSTLDFPQNIRIVEIVYNNDGTGEIWLTIVDHDSAMDSVPWNSRGRALWNLHYGFQPDNYSGMPVDRNVRLRFRIPAGIQARLDALPYTPVETKNFYNSAGDADLP